MTVTLNVRHATQPVIRRVTWLVSESMMEHAILGRDVLSRLGLDNRSLMAAACDRFDGDVHVGAAQEIQLNGGEIASLLESLEHSSLFPQ